MRLKQWFLVLSAVTIFGVGSLYGVRPAWFAATFFGVTDLDVNFAHLLRAIMCLYAGFGLFWLYAAFNDAYRSVAILTVMLFPAALAIGRIISVAVDGPPSPLLSFYLVAEFVQAPLAYWVFRRPD
jgi:Domain of unknown function (DUF4345)